MGNDQFAFTIIDDTDLATVENVKPIYDLLAKLGIRTTKTVWPLRCEDKSNPYFNSGTLEDQDYANWIRDLQEEGFEIALHGVSADSNKRQKIQQGLHKFEDILGCLPTMHINHERNRDNLYWGTARFNSPLVRMIVRLAAKNRRQVFDGHDPASQFFWGDICQETIRYCRNLVFADCINLFTINPTMPYTDVKRPDVPRWFSSGDGGDPKRFVNLLRRQNIAKLVRQRGVCIIYTHFGLGFTSQGEVLPQVEQALRNIAALSEGLFIPATELLDRLCTTAINQAAPILPAAERRRMEWLWLWQKLITGGTS